MKTGILVASFGTTHLDTLGKTIAVIERDVASAFPQATCYRAFTSGVVRRKLKAESDLSVDSVEEAVERMKADGIERMLLLPTLVIPGDEYERLCAGVLRNAGEMEVVIGRPLLWDDRDLAGMMDILAKTYPTDDDTVLVAMGHGTEHACECLYVRLAEWMERSEQGMALCTVDGVLDFNYIIGKLKKQSRRNAHLVPLLIVAGDHSKNDMAGDQPDSLRGRLEQEGFKVTWALQGLGEIPAIRERFIAQAASDYNRFQVRD